ncbi:MAG: L,D-transpeptidase family protein [Bdellovibrionales bacterium]|nr:L,D-transpeptidase family protein [Bdellovibrionales bacterium]
MKYILAVLFLVSSAKVFAADLCDYEKQFDSLPEISEETFKAFLYSGQNVDQILISKKKRHIYLFSGKNVVKSFVTAFGDPNGPKHFDGDMKTPEGVYYIDSKNPRSAFHLSLHISYPNAADIAYAKKFGKSPGGDIMIHGFPKDPFARGFVEQAHPLDWTRGCVAVTDPEIEQIYAIVPKQTPVTICPL